MEEMQAVAAGRTTAEEILLRFGEPTSVAPDHSSFSYEWRYEHGRWFLAASGGYGGGVYHEFPGRPWRSSFVVEFDARRVVSQRCVWLNQRTVIDDGAPAWMGDLERALAVAAEREKLVAVFVPFACAGTPCADPRCAASLALEAELGETYEHGARYVTVRADEGLAGRLGVARAPAVVMLGWDGLEVCRREPARPGEGRALLTEMLARAPSRRSIGWRTPDDASTSGRRPEGAMLLAFTDGTKQSENLRTALEEPECAILHDRLFFVTCEWRQDSPEAKRWDAGEAPMLVLVDATGTALGRMARWHSPLEIKVFLMRGLAKFDAARRG